MRALFFILVLLHSLIHLLGFVKGFGLMEVKALSSSISKLLGSIWFLAAALLLSYGIAFLSESKQAWIIGTFAVIISQALIFYFWKDAKFGTLPNIAILVAILISYSSLKFTTQVEKERKEILKKSLSDKPPVFSESEIELLPFPVKKWLHSCGAIGQPKASSGKIMQVAQMKMKPEQENWYQAEAIQYTVIDEPSFIWKVKLKMNPFIWIQGRDKFQDGEGEMLIKMNSLVNLVDESGAKIDEGTLQRFLGEMVWFPSLAVSPYVTWEEQDELSAKATMNYKGTIGSGIFYFNEEGDFVKYIAFRYDGNKPDSKRKPWILTVDDYRIFEGIKVPSKMNATWELEQGEWNWLKLEIKNLEYNQPFNSHNDIIIP
jgi:hypothetical protein